MVSTEASGKQQNLTRQQTRFLALMQGYEDAAEYSEKAANSIGVSARKMEVYEESLEAKTNRLTAAFENMSTSLIPSELIGSFLDAGTAALNFGAELNGIPVTIAAVVASLFTLITAINAIQASSLGTSIKSTIGIIPGFIANMNAVGAVLTMSATSSASLGAAFSSMTAQQVLNTAVTKRMAAEDLKAALAKSALTQDVQEAILAQYLDVTAKTADTAAGAAQTVGNGALVVSWGAVTAGIWSNIKAMLVWMATNPLGWIIAIGAAIGGTALAIAHHNKQIEESIQKAQELQDAYKSASDSISSSISTLESMKDEFNELSKGVDQHGKNISLSTDEYTRYLKIVQDIINVNPSVIKGYTDEGNAIIDKNSALTESIELLKQQRQLELLKATSSSNNWDIAKGVRNNLQQAKKEVEQAKLDLQDALYKSIASSSGTRASAQNASWIESINGTSSEDVFSYFGNLFDIDLNQFANKNYTGNWRALFSQIAETSSNYSEIIKDNIAEINLLVGNDGAATISKALSDLNSATNNEDIAASGFKNQMTLIAQAADGYDKLNDATKSFLGSWFNTWKFVGDETPEKIQEIEYAIRNMVFSLSNDSYSQIKLSTLLSIDLDKTAISDFDTVVADAESAIQALARENGWDENGAEVATLRALIGLDVVVTDKNGNEVNEKEYLLSQFKEKTSGKLSDEDINKLSLGELKIAANLDLRNVKSYSDLLRLLAEHAGGAAQEFNGLEAAIKQFDEASSKIEKLQKLLKELSEQKGKKLSAEFLSELYELLPDVANKVTSVTDAQNVLTEAIGSTESMARNAYGSMLIANEEWLTKTINNSASLQNALATYYKGDITNWKKNANAKWTVDAALISNLSSMWAQYMGMTDQQLSAEIAALEAWSIDRGFTLTDDEADQLRTMRTIREFRRGMKEDFEALDFSFEGSSSKKSTELYISNIDALYESTLRLKDVQNEMSTLEAKNNALSEADYRKKIENSKEIIRLRGEENRILNEQNTIRRSSIQAGIGELVSYGFKIDYDPASNDLLIKNMEHINDLVAPSGKVEDTNKLRKAIEALIEKIRDYNDDAIEASLQWHENFAQNKKDTEALTDAVKEYYDAWESDQQHEIDMMTNQGGQSDKIIAAYYTMMDQAHAAAEEIRALMREQGFTEAEIEHSDAIQALESSWYDYYNSIKSLQQERLDSLNEELDLVKDMIKQEKEDEIDALEAQADAYAEIIRLKKESLELTERERTYNEQVGDLNKEISKLQARADALALDDSRSAQLERGSILEELADKQKELADLQRDHSIEQQQDALDQEQKDFESAQDKKIKEIKDFLADNQKLTQAAMDRIESSGASLFDELRTYALKYTDTTETALVQMWEKAKEAAEGYASFADALAQTEHEANNPSINGSGTGSAGVSDAYIISQMKQNSAAWHGADEATQRDLQKANIELARRLNLKPERDFRNGRWYWPNSNVPVYHTGGIVGDRPTTKQKELMLLAEKGEAIFTERHQDNLIDVLKSHLPQIDMTAMLKPLASLLGQTGRVTSAPTNATINMTIYANDFDDFMNQVKAHKREVADVLINPFA